MSEAQPIIIPRATYRFQFNENFRLTDAQQLIPYLRDLGISHLYASPLLRATPRSQHGYDVCDFSELNPEVGTPEDLERLVGTLREYGMGLVLDIVPNHMGVGTCNNSWWQDVLTHGPESRFAGYFDIDWDSPDPRLRGKVLLPVLEDYYPRLLEKKLIQLCREGDDFHIEYRDNRFPLNPASLGALVKITNAALETINNDPGRLDELLLQQFYRLTFWRHGDAELNYRRFFSITTLAGIRTEKEKVFEDSHRLVLEWVRKGWIDGLRVDHPDGLRYPQEYCERLRGNAPGCWLVVEKILESNESLPSWPVEGTTGYDFIAQVDGLFINRRGETTLSQFYQKLTGDTVSYENAVRSRKLQVLRALFQTEVARLVRLLIPIAAQRWQSRDLGRVELRHAIEELAACFPVYRTYVHAPSPDAPTHSITAQDRGVIERAVACARERGPSVPAEAIELLRALLLLEIPGDAASDFVARFQQLTVSTMAKGVEDTLYYSFNRFVALNEVGDDPSQFGLPLKDFHAICAERLKKWPNSMLASSTHDTKRSEDVRARLSAISEIPERWCDNVQRWREMNHRHGTEYWPDRNAEYHFYQILVGAWPLSTERAIAYMEKASREAKRYTDWTEPNEQYHAALKKFVTGTLGDTAFVSEIEQFVADIADAGFTNSLAQNLLKMTLPGVPDFYQGTELWEYTLVDPDNRRPVDFAARVNLLKKVRGMDASQAWQQRLDGSAKLWLIQKVLSLRAQHPDYFDQNAAYMPILAQGPKAQHAFAFARGERAVIIVPRMTIALKGAWMETAIPLPPGKWQNLFNGHSYEGVVPVESVLKHFPVAVLVRKENS